MAITVDTEDRRPIYRQVADEIKAQIASGHLKEGAVLPPVRQLAADLGVNLNTVAVAYRELQAEGLIAIRHGSGAVVASTKTTPADEEDLRKPLRPALTQMVLSGMRRADIIAAVSDELRGLLKGAK
jgi:GntR family transcriptional regulator